MAGRTRAALLYLGVTSEPRAPGAHRRPTATRRLARILVNTASTFFWLLVFKLVYRHVRDAIGKGLAGVVGGGAAAVVAGSLGAFGVAVLIVLYEKHRPQR